MPSFVRAFFRCPDDPTSNLTADLCLGDDRKVMQRVPTGGWWGKIQTNDFWPFIMLNGALLDFGNPEGDPIAPEDRYAALEIQDRIIAVGEFYDFTYGDRDIRFQLERLTNIADLLTRGG
jgi:hypothetical protein